MARETNPPAHRTRYTQSGAGAGLHSEWLRHALAWVDREFQGNPLRWTLRDVYQALATKAALTGEIRSGTPIVGVGGRSLSLSAGLLSATATFDALRRTRDMIGAPIVLVRHHVGRDADFYALTTTHPEAISPVPGHRVRLEDVHPAWSILGRHHRYVYELIVHAGLTSPVDVYAAAKVSPRTGQHSLAALATAGLITRRRGRVGPGATTLDALAAAHHLDDVLAARIARYRSERADWHAWLALQDQIKGIPAAHADELEGSPHGPVFAHHQEYLRAVLVHGPPVDQDRDDHAAIDLLCSLLGARILATAR